MPWLTVPPPPLPLSPPLTLKFPQADGNTDAANAVRSVGDGINAAIQQGVDARSCYSTVGLGASVGDVLGPPGAVVGAAIGAIVNPACRNAVSDAVADYTGDSPQASASPTWGTHWPAGGGSMLPPPDPGAPLMPATRAPAARLARWRRPALRTASNSAMPRALIASLGTWTTAAASATPTVLRQTAPAQPRQ